MWHPGGKYLLSASDDKTLRVWDLAHRRCHKRLDAHTHFTTSIGQQQHSALLSHVYMLPCLQISTARSPTWWRAPWTRRSRCGSVDNGARPPVSTPSYSSTSSFYFVTCWASPQHSDNVQLLGYNWHSYEIKLQTGRELSGRKPGSSVRGSDTFLWRNRWFYCVATSEQNIVLCEDTMWWHDDDD